MHMKATKEISPSKILGRVVSEKGRPEVHLKEGVRLRCKATPDTTPLGPVFEVTRLAEEESIPRWHYTMGKSYRS